MALKASKKKAVQGFFYFLKSVLTCLEGKKNKKASQQHHLFILFLIPTYLILMRPFWHVLREFLKQLFFLFVGCFFVGLFGFF